MTWAPGAAERVRYEVHRDLCACRGIGLAPAAVDGIGAGCTAAPTAGETRGHLAGTSRVQRERKAS